MYDLNGDGVISREEMENVTASVGAGAGARAGAGVGKGVGKEVRRYPDLRADGSEHREGGCSGGQEGRLGVSGDRI